MFILNYFKALISNFFAGETEETNDNSDASVEDEETLDIIEYNRQISINRVKGVNGNAYYNGDANNSNLTNNHQNKNGTSRSLSTSESNISSINACLSQDNNDDIFLRRWEALRNFNGERYLYFIMVLQSLFNLPSVQAMELEMKYKCTHLENDKFNCMLCLFTNLKNYVYNRNHANIDQFDLSTYNSLFDLLNSTIKDQMAFHDIFNIIINQLQEVLVKNASSRHALRGSSLRNTPMNALFKISVREESKCLKHKISTVEKDMNIIKCSNVNDLNIGIEEAFRSNVQTEYCQRCKADVSVAKTQILVNPPEILAFGILDDSPITSDIPKIIDMRDYLKSKSRGTKYILNSIICKEGEKRSVFLRTINNEWFEIKEGGDIEPCFDFNEFNKSKYSKLVLYNQVKAPSVIKALRKANKIVKKEKVDTLNSPEQNQVGTSSQHQRNGAQGEMSGARRVSKRAIKEEVEDVVVKEEEIERIEERVVVEKKKAAKRGRVKIAH